MTLRPSYLTPESRASEMERKIALFYKLDPLCVPFLGYQSYFPFTLTMNTAGSVIQRSMQYGITPQSWVLTQGTEKRIITPSGVKRPESDEEVDSARREMGEHVFCSEHGFIPYVVDGVKRTYPTHGPDTKHLPGVFVHTPSGNTPKTDGLLIWGDQNEYPPKSLFTSFSMSPFSLDLTSNVPLGAVIMFEREASRLLKKEDKPEFDRDKLVQLISDSFPKYVDKWLTACGLKDGIINPKNPASVELNLSRGKNNIGYDIQVWIQLYKSPDGKDRSPNL